MHALLLLMLLVCCHYAEQNLKDSTITPHEDKKYAATA